VKIVVVSTLLCLILPQPVLSLSTLHHQRYLKRTSVLEGVSSSHQAFGFGRFFVSIFLIWMLPQFTSSRFLEIVDLSHFFNSLIVLVNVGLDCAKVPRSLMYHR